jgi:predicted  nucleic acid-binding Zn-ribbon protein
MVLLSLNAFAKDVPYTLEDRDRLIRIETSLKEFKDSVDKRFEQVDKRFEQVDKRFEQVDKRFEQVDKRFEQIINFLWMLVTIFVGITGVTIGFAIWDRRSMIRPFETKVKQIEGELELEKDKVENLILSLRELAKKDENVSAILKRFNLL